MVRIHKENNCKYAACYEAVNTLKKLCSEIELLDKSKIDYDYLLQDILHEMDLCVHAIATINRDNVAHVVNQNN